MVWTPGQPSASVIDGQSSQHVHHKVTLMIPNKGRTLSVALSFLFGMSGKSGGWSDHLKAQHCPNAVLWFGVVAAVIIELGQHAKLN